MPLTEAIKKLGPWAILEYIANPALSLMLTPLIIHRLGLAGFGQWVLIITVATLPVALTSGISVALARHLAANSSASLDVLRSAQVDALVTTLAASVLGSCATVGWLAFQVGSSSGPNQHDWLMLTFVAFVVISDCLDATLAGILRGDLRYAQSARAEVTGRIAQYASMLAAVAAVPSIAALAAATLAGSCIRVLLRGRLCDLSWISANRIKVARSVIHSPLLAMTGWATAQSLGGTLYTSLDRLVISAAFGPATLGIYAATSQLTNQIQAVLGAAFSVVVNATARHSVAVDQRTLARDFSRLSCLVAMGALVSYFIFYESAAPLFTLWLGAATTLHLSPLIPAVVLAAAAQTVVMPAHFFLLGSGRFKLVAALGLLAGAISITLLWFASQFLQPSQALFARAAYGLVLCSYFFVIYRTLDHRESAKP